MWRKGVVLGLLSFSFLPGCFEYPVSIEEFPLWSIESHESAAGLYVDVKLKNSAALRHVIKSDLFEAFWPSITHDEATARFGEPMLIRRFGHDTHYYYPVSLGTIEIARERSVSWGAATVWKLRFFPRDSDPSTFLDESVAQYLSVGDSFVHVRIRDFDETTKTVFVGKEGRVMYAIRINARNTKSGAEQDAPLMSDGADH